MLVGNVPKCSNYHITQEGKLYSKLKGSWKLVKPIIRSNGYVHNILVDDNGKKVKYYRHRLVAMVYIPNPENKPQVCHRDNNKLNNSVRNLYWGTRQENMQQCISDGRFYFVGKEREVHVEEKELVNDYILGIPRKEIINKFGMSVRTFYKILKRNGIRPHRNGKR